MLSFTSLFTAFYLALAFNPTSLHALPIPIHPSAVVPVRYSGSLNPQRPFARPSATPILRFATETDDLDVLSPSTILEAVDDTIFADSVPAGVAGVTASAVSSAEQLDRAELQRKAYTMILRAGRAEKKMAKRAAKRDWVVPGQPRVVDVSSTSTTASPTTSIAVSPTIPSTSSLTSSITSISSTTTASPTAVSTPLTDPSPSTSSSTIKWYIAIASATTVPRASFGTLGSLED